MVDNFTWGGGENLYFNITLLFSDVLLVGILYLLISRRSRYKKMLRLNNHDKYLFLVLLLFISVAGISTYFSYFPFSSLLSFIQLIKLSIIFLLSKALFSDKQVLEESINTIILFVVFNSLLIIFQYINRGAIGLYVEDKSTPFGWFAKESIGLFRSGGIFSDPNIAATISCIFTPYILLSVIMKNRFSFIGLAILLVTILGIILTGSRASWIIFIITTVAVLLFIKKNILPERFNKILSVVKVVIFVLVIAFGPFMFRRLTTLTNAFSDIGGVTYRIKHLQTSWYFIKTNPFGVGIGVFPYVTSLKFPFRQTGIYPTYAHNIFASIGAETGYIGFAIFCYFLFLVLKMKYRTLKRNSNYLNFALMLAFIVFLLLSNLFPWISNPKISPLFFLLAAI